MTDLIEFGLIAAGITLAIIFAIFVVGDDLSILYENNPSIVQNTATTTKILSCEKPNNKIERFIPSTVHMNSNGVWGTFEDGRSFEYSISVKCWLEEIVQLKEKLD